MEGICLGDGKGTWRDTGVRTASTAKDGGKGPRRPGTDFWTATTSPGVTSTQHPSRGDRHATLPGFYPTRTRGWGPRVRRAPWRTFPWDDLHSLVSDSGSRWSPSTPGLKAEGDVHLRWTCSSGHWSRYCASYSRSSRRDSTPGSSTEGLTRRGRTHTHSLRVLGTQTRSSGGDGALGLQVRGSERRGSETHGLRLEVQEESRPSNGVWEESGQGGFDEDDWGLRPWYQWTHRPVLMHQLTHRPLRFGRGL